MAVHPGAAQVEQDRARGPLLNGAVDGAADRRRQRHQHDPGSLAHDAQHAMAIFLTEVGDLGGGGFKMRRPSRPSMVTRAKSYRLVDVRAAVSMASNCRWVSPNVGDSGGTVGRRTYSAGEWERTPSITQVR